MAKGDEETYWILRKDQLACLASPVRADIVDHLAGRGPMPIRDIAASLGRRPSALYYHVEKLVESGLVEVAGEDTSGRRPELLYKTKAPRMRAKKALADAGSRDIVVQMVGATLKQADRDFARGFEKASSRVDGDDRNHGFYRTVSRPDAAALAKVNKHLDQIAEILWSSRGKNEGLVSLAWTMAPLSDGDGAKD